MAMSGRPDRYQTKLGETVPGVTTILGRFKDSGGLIHWAWKQGKDGLDYRKTRDKAGDTGTMCHDVVHCIVRGEDPPMPAPDLPKEQRVEIARGVEAFGQWWTTVTPEVLAAEEPMVSTAHAFGGTPDAIMRVDGRLAVADWKTSGSGPYVDWLLQLGAYSILWEEHSGEQADLGLVVHLDKTKATYREYRWNGDAMSNARAQFLRLRECFEMDRWLKRTVA